MATGMGSFCLGDAFLECSSSSLIDCGARRGPARGPAALPRPCRSANARCPPLLADDLLLVPQRSCELSLSADSTGDLLLDWGLENSLEVRTAPPARQGPAFWRPHACASPPAPAQRALVPPSQVDSSSSTLSSPDVTSR